MRKLYHQIYLAFLGILLLFGALVAVLWLLTPKELQDRRLLDGVSGYLGEILPAQDRPLSELQGAVERLGKWLPLDMAVTASDGTRLVAVGGALPAPPRDNKGSRWTHFRGPRPVAAISLPDGRWVMVRVHHKPGGVGALVALFLMFAAIALGTYPVVRRLTRRLERLQNSVDALGAGDLAARVEVQGKDEVANLAGSFNRTAERIERLVTAQRNTLAGASHELRTPLARMRMAVELLPSETRPEIRRRLSEDIKEVDDLIGEFLMASRLQALDRPDRSEEVDLLALLAEEGARTGAEVTGAPMIVRGDPRMLRRLVRNLLENGRRYAGGSAVEASVARSGAGAALLSVADRGPGVPDSERERIFQPFYRPPGAPSEGGIGLGLALVRQIAQHHGGQVRCLDREGGGTTFQVELPTGSADSS